MGVPYRDSGHSILIVMRSSAIQPGSVATATVSGTRKLVTIVGWSADKVHVVVRVQLTGNQLYRTPRQLTLVVR